MKSLLQRARAIIADVSPHRDEGLTRAASTTEREVVARYIRAHELADHDEMAALLAKDVKLTMPPLPHFLCGHAALMALTREVFDPNSPQWHGRWRSLPVRANGQPAVAHYCERPSANETKGLSGAYKAQVLDVLRLNPSGGVVEITAFPPETFSLFHLPLTREVDAV